MSSGSKQINFDHFPRVRLGHLPTPIEALPRLSDHLGGPSFFVKRDDCTGLATGGNKTRKLEFLVGDAIEQKADMLVTQGAVQSNHVRQTAAAACRFGMTCHGLLERRVPERPKAYEETGNVFLDRMFGASLEFREAGADMNAEAAATAERLQREGRRPYFIPGGGSNEIGALGYANCAQEIARQCDAMEQSFDWLVTATGSTGTQGGLVAGFHALDRDQPIMGISVRLPKAKQIQAVSGLVERTLDKIAESGIAVDKASAAAKVNVDDGYVGEGYGVPAASTLEAISLMAKFEGILLDPVYSGKGFAGLIGLTRQGFFKPSDRVLFLHTGGSTALFAYEEINDLEALTTAG